ncbi:hypothetical protein ACSSVY_001126 [Roseovarius sp. MBR-51]
MSHDLCPPYAPARSSKAPSAAPIAVILLAALVIAALAPAPQAPTAHTQPPASEDWHGNVMRSHWAGAEQPR